MKTFLGEEYAKRFVNVALSMNEQSKRLFQEENVSASFNDVQPTLDSLDAIHDELSAVEARSYQLEGTARDYMLGMTRAFGYYLRVLQGDTIPYLELIEAIQQIALEPVSADQLDERRARLDEALGHAGYSGTLDDKVTAWLDDTSVSGDEVIALARDYLDRAKADTLDRVVTLPPEDEIEEVIGVRGVFWTAYSKYRGAGKGFIRLNVDHRWPRHVMAYTMCHEGYPGHQAFYCLWDHLFKNDEWPLEAALYFINSPNNVLFEGAPDNGLHFLGWDRDDYNGFAASITPGLQLAALYGDVKRSTTLNAAYMVNVEGMSQREVSPYLQKYGFMTPVEATDVYRFFTDPVNRTYYPAYYYGRKIVRETYDAMQGREDEYFKMLYHEPHTVETFTRAVKEATGRQA